MVSKRQNAPSQVVAVAGISGEVGAHVVEELLDLNKLDVVILLRKENPELIESLRKRYPEGIKRLRSSLVSYNVETLKKIFKEHRVDTVISCVWVNNPDEFRSVQNALLEASIAVPSVRRFSPTDWGFGISENATFRPRVYAPKFDIVPALNASPLNWHSFSCGFFANYACVGAPKRVETLNGVEFDPVMGHALPYPFMFNPETWAVKIGVDEEGKEQLLSFTRIQDVAKIAVRSCLLDNLGWSGGSAYISAFTLTVSDALSVHAKISGKAVNITKIKSSDWDKEFDQNLAPLATFRAELRSLTGKYPQAWENELGALLESQGLGFELQGLEEILKLAWIGR